MKNLHIIRIYCTRILQFQSHSSEASSGSMEARRYILTQANSVHILWLLPQYIVITVGEVMFSITGLEFSYSQVQCFNFNVNFVLK